MTNLLDEEARIRNLVVNAWSPEARAAASQTRKAKAGFHIVIKKAATGKTHTTWDANGNKKLISKEEFEKEVASLEWSKELKAFTKKHLTTTSFQTAVHAYQAAKGKLPSDVTRLDKVSGRYV